MGVATDQVVLGRRGGHVTYVGGGSRAEERGLPGQVRGDPVASAVAEFGLAVATKLGRGGEDEEQLRAPLETLLKNLGKHVGVDTVSYGEVHLKDVRARPDYAVDVGNSRVGYIELKAPERGVPLSPNWKPTRRERNQWEKLQALPNVIYTDGTTWCRYRFGAAVSPFVKLAGSVSDRRRPLRPSGPGFATLIHDFLLWKPEKPRSLPDLINVVARLCDLLHDEVYSILTGSPEHRAHEHLTLLADDWRRLLFPGLNDRKFADAFAQTITFSLLLARSAGIDFDGASLHEIGRQLSKHHSLIGRAFTVLTDTAAEELRTIETLRRVIGVVDWQEYPTDAYAELYERFLAAYDPKLRKDTGSYYTPPPLARFMVDFVNQVLRTRLSQPWGFGEDDVIVVDPAMGTATFLFEVLRTVAQVVSSRLGPGSVRDHLRELVRNRLIGFEIQVAPYAAAELRIHQALRKIGVDVPPRELRFLTDALSNPLVEQQHLGAAYHDIEAARNRANEIKLTVPVMVVIGNPPHVSDAKGRAPWITARRRYPLSPTLTAERPSLDEFRARVDGQGRYESDLHGTPWYFWRWACWKVFEAQRHPPSGVVAFITPSSLLTGRAFAGIREYLRRNCDEGWVIELSPEGNHPPVPTRVFGPEIGRTLCIAIFARRSDGDVQRPAEVRYLALHGSRDAKVGRLAHLTPSDPAWALCKSGWLDAFVPASRTGWDAFPPMHDLMPWRSRGVTTGRTWIYAPTPEVLTRRWRQFIAAGDVLRRALFPNSREWTIDKRVKPLPGFGPARPPLSQEDGQEHDATPVAHRSFDRQWIIPDRRLITRARLPMWQVRSDDQIYVSQQDAHAIASGPALVFTALIPDLHHFSGRSGGVHPLWRDRDATLPNIVPRLLDYLSRRFTIPVSVNDFLAYIAAVVAHPGFTARFRDVLRQPGVHIPLSASTSTWEEAASVGRHVIWLHTFGERYDDPSMGRPRGARALIQRYSVKCLSPVTALPDRLPDRLPYDAQSQTLLVGDGAFGPVPQAVLEYDVDGWRVLWHWLNDRMANPRNKQRSSRLDDEVRVTSWEQRFTNELLALLAVLTGCIQLQSKQVDVLHRVCDGPLISTADLRDAGILPFDKGAAKPPPPDDSGGTPLLDAAPG